VNASSRTKTIRRHETVLTMPDCLGELGKAIAYAQAEFERRNGRKVGWDNDINLAITDDEIVLWFEIETTEA
jgi:hypothetical protein